MANRLLFIEDEPNLQSSLAYLLEREGFALRTAASGEEGLELAAAEAPDLVLLDVNLPGIDGFETARRLRREASTQRVPIIMLTARAHPDDIVAGLSDFADDYVTKPFLPRVLIARIQALLRRSTSTEAEKPAPAALCFPKLLIRREAHEVSVEGRALKLTKSEYDILLLLAAHPNRVFTRAQIIDHLRGDDYAITERVVDFQVSGLRKKLGSSASYIETVRGVGYKFQA